MQQASPHVWAEVRYDGANVGMVVGRRGVVLVESPMCPCDARDWLRQVRAVTGQEILFIATTDHHFDHSVCSGMLCPNIVMHADAAAALPQVRRDMKDLFRRFYADRFAQIEADLDALEIPEPAITFTDRLAINLGDVQVSLIHTGGHTQGTCLVFVEPDRTLFAGDNVTHQRHAYMGEMSLSKWLAALDAARMLQPRAVVPGHGDLCGAEGVREMQRFFLRLKECVAAGMAQGLSLEEIVAQTKPELGAFFPIAPGRERMIPEWVEDGLRLGHGEMQA